MARKRRRKQSAVIAVILLLNICITSSLAFLSQRCTEPLTRVFAYSATRLLLERPTGAGNPHSLVNSTAVSARRRRQTRRKPTNRRPKYYWTDLKNVERELREFWISSEVTIASTNGDDNNDNGTDAYTNKPPLIPNNQLLNHYQRHDLRAAIYAYGGRECLAASLGGARIMPGRWTDAVQESPELRKLLQIDPTLSTERTLFSPRQGTTSVDEDTATDRDVNDANYNGNDDDHPEGSQQNQEETIRSGRWLHQSGRKPKGYWSLRVVIQELYEYVDDYRTTNGRPAVWMPRPSELASLGRDDLRQAFVRFGGAQKICRMAGMVPFREWHYFEGQLELLSELKRYLDEFADSDYTAFPSVSDIQRNGYEQLHALIQYYGGRKFLAARLSMTGVPQVAGDDFADMNWGPFDLDFAVRLLYFVRQNQLHKNPPLQNPALVMPSQSKLLASGSEGMWMDCRVQDFGGYENVARRLGLAFFETDLGLSSSASSRFRNF